MFTEGEHMSQTSSKKLKEIVMSLDLPEDVTVSVKDGKVSVSGPLGTLKEDLSHMGISIWAEKGKFYARAEGSNRRLKAMVGTCLAKVRNMVIGVTKGYKYKLKIVASHFPMSVKVSGKTVMIENFLGERQPRRVEVVGDAKVKVEGDDVIVYGTDKYSVGQTAANIEKATRIKAKDPRKFLDGIYIYEKSLGM